MNLIELADLEKQIGNLEAQLDHEALTETQIDHIYNEIARLEDRKESLLNRNTSIHRMPWYDENY